MDVSTLRRVVDLRDDKRSLNAASWDSGMIVFRKPRTVAVPQSADDVLQVIRWANRSNCPVSSRGTGHTQKGQSLTSGGIAIDMRNLKRLGDIEGETIQVQGGVLWRDLVAHVLPQGYLPMVLTNNLDTTVGGTLATGGLGRSSHHYGLQANNVEAMQVATGSGQLVRCSETENKELFDCSRCGLGQFSVITQARIRLRKARPNVRTFCLIYDEPEPLLEDIETMLARGQFMYLRSWCRHRSQEFGFMEDAGAAGPEWRYPLHASVEFDNVEPNQDELLEGLNHVHLLRTADQSLMDFSDMLEPMPYAASRRVCACPVTEGLLPWSAVPTYIARLLERFPPALLPYCNMMLRPVHNALLTPPMLRAPKTGLGVGFGIIPYVPRIVLADGLKVVEGLGRLLTAHGGKRYLTGWVNYDHDQWQAHYGELWPHILKWKARFDPKGILNPGFIHYRPQG